MNKPAPPFALTARELTVLQTLPAALDALIEWHEVQATLADGMDMPECVAVHDERKAAIRAEVQRLDRLMVDGFDRERATPA